MPEVLALVGTTSLETADVVGIISDVSGWIDRELVGHCDDQSPEQLEAIERWLSAIRIAQAGTTAASGALKRSTRADVTEEYETDTSAGSDMATRLGTMAAALDPCGIVGEAFFGKRRARASFIRGYASA